MTDQLKDLRRRIVADGRISDIEVDALRAELMAGGLDRQKADFLFDLKDSVQQSHISHKFAPFFVDAITAYLLEDDESPGEIDDAEARWLRAKIQYRGRLDAIDRALLKSLKAKSINFPALLQYKTRRTRWFEHLLYGSRYLTILSVIGSIVAAIVLFIKGIVVIYEAIAHSFHTAPGQSFFENAEYEHLFAGLVSSVDIFLFALALLIFGVGVYELFVTKIDPVEQQADSRPSWLRIPSVDDLKSNLGKVILMVLIVSFFKHTLNLETWDPQSLLFLSIGILLISAALYLTHKDHPAAHSKRHDNPE